MTLVCIPNRLGVKQKKCLFIIFESLHFAKLLVPKNWQNISYQLAIMTLIRISNHLGVKQKNAFIIFESLHFTKILLPKKWQKHFLPICYYDFNSYLRPFRRKQKNEFLSFLKAFILKKHISPLDGATYQKYCSPILSSYPNLWGESL